jgi:hypothetical protein
VQYPRRETSRIVRVGRFGDPGTAVSRLVGTTLACILRRQNHSLRMPDRVGVGMRIHVLPTSAVVEATGERDDTHALLGLLLTRTDRITFATMQQLGSACWAREGVTLEPEPEIPKAEARIRALVAEPAKAEGRIRGLVEADDGVATPLTGLIDGLVFANAPELALRAVSALKLWEQAKVEELA